MKYSFILERKEKEHLITKETDGEFMGLVTLGALQALRERGILSQIQYRFAAERLEQKIREKKRHQNRKDAPND